MNNKYYFTIQETDRGIDLPVEIKWDFEGRTDAIDEYQYTVLEEVIGLPEDFEIARFSHDEYTPYNQTNIKYNFYFFSGNPTTVTTATDASWVNSYLAEGFTAKEIFYFSKPFTKSFFKLDFYDTKDNVTQKNYFTIIIPVQQGDSEFAKVSPTPPFNNILIKKPSYKLDFVGDKEGFFIYWLRNLEFLNLETFYMSAKFFDGRLGVFVKMMNKPQSTLPNKFSFNGNDYFYYRVSLDYNTKTYKVFNESNNRVGTTTPIKWYEYVNPPQ